MKRKLAFLLVLSLVATFLPALFAYDAKAASSDGGQAAHSHKTLYLTIDMDMNRSMERKYLDGKIRYWYDPGIFSYLQNHHISATFFVSGLFAKTYPDLMKALSKNQNYSFENHSYDESSFTPHCFWLKTLTTDQEKIDQINATQDILAKLTGHTPTLFRYPGLCHSSHDDILVEKLGFQIDNGTLSAGDPFSHNAGAIENKIFKQAKDGSAIVMHVGGPNAPMSLQILQRIVPQLQQEGFSFSKL